MPQGRPKAPTPGQLLRYQPTGAPVFYLKKRLPRVVTSDPWAFLRYRARIALPKEAARRVSSYVDQAFDFFESAANPRTSSRPLLYYYSFLNLAKVFVLLKGTRQLPLLFKHGISDPKANVKKRLRFEGQRVQLAGRAHDHSEFFPEFLNAFGTTLASGAHSFRVIRLLSQIPGIHRTSCMVLDHPPRFCPVEALHFYSKDGQVWATLKINPSDKDVSSSLPKIRSSRRFRALFSQVEGSDDQIWFETNSEAGQKKGTDKAIGRLCARLREVGFYAILTQKGYRYYLGNFAPREVLPQLCAIHAVMFYLGSITRYKPHYFDAIVSRGYDWLVAEFLETQPTQFLYLLSSHAAGAEVIKPHATATHG
jgi:hypothetical protein